MTIEEFYQKAKSLGYENSMFSFVIVPSPHDYIEVPKEYIVENDWEIYWDDKITQLNYFVE